jgi:hypothetical protein
VASVPGYIRECLSTDAYWASMDADFQDWWRGGITECKIFEKELAVGSVKSQTRKNAPCERDSRRSRN